MKKAPHIEVVAGSTLSELAIQEDAFTGRRKVGSILTTTPFSKRIRCMSRSGPKL
jgi:hypothetical protein